MTPHRIALFCLCFLTTMFSLSGCSTASAPLTAEQRQQLGKVYLYGASHVHETFFHGDIRKGGVGGAMRGIGAGAADGLGNCLDSAIAAGPLGPLVLAICAPLQVPAGMVEGGRAGSKPLISEEALDELKNKANQTLQDADLNGALVAATDEQSQRLAMLAPYEMAHGILPTPTPQQTIEQIATQWGYATVLHIEVTQAGFETDDGRAAMMHFSMKARVRLVDAHKNKTLYSNDYNYNSAPQPVGYWFKNDYKLLADEIVKGNRQVASDLLKDVFMK